jgi:hypothetical protein
VSFEVQGVHLGIGDFLTGSGSRRAGRPAAVPTGTDLMPVAATCVGPQYEVAGRRIGRSPVILPRIGTGSAALASVPNTRGLETHWGISDCDCDTKSLLCMGAGFAGRSSAQ